MSRINVTGTQNDYNLTLLGETDEYKPSDEYRAQTLNYVDWNMSWYKPEIFGETLLYSNVQSFGEKEYNYIYATHFGSVQSVKENIVGYKEVKEEIDSASDSKLQNAMTYFFRTGKTKVYDDIKEDVYTDKQQDKFTEFVSSFEGTDAKFKLESEYIRLFGRVNEEDAKEMAQSWVDLLTPATDALAEESGLPTWAIVLISVGGGALVIGGVVAVVLIRKKKLAKKREEEATVNAYRRKKIDTTDDKSIDVYADDDAETQETAENTAEEEKTQE